MAAEVVIKYILVQLNRMTALIECIHVQAARVRILHPIVIIQEVAVDKTLIIILLDHLHAILVEEVTAQVEEVHAIQAVDQLAVVAEEFVEDKVKKDTYEIN